MKSKTSVVPRVSTKKITARILVILTSFCPIVRPFDLPKNVSAPPAIAPESPCCFASCIRTEITIQIDVSKIKIPKISNCKSLLILHKQRFLCKHCNNTFIAETNLVDRNKNISNNTELQIKLELMKKQSEKDIAERTGVSVSKINRVLNHISSHTVLRHENLPTNMNWDKFKATKDTKGKMAFIITNTKKHKTFDILESRKSNYLKKYFFRFHRKQRLAVKFIIIDLFGTYYSLFKSIVMVVPLFSSLSTAILPP